MCDAGLVGIARIVVALAFVSVLPGLSGLTGCASEVADAPTGKDAYTVETGHKFVVRAEPHEVVLRRSVDGRAFPLSREQLIGKAILIHPVEGKTGGVYARVLFGREDEKELVLATEPLSLAEMAQLTEDDVVRIFLDPRLDVAPEKEPALHRASLAPRSWGGLAMDEVAAMGEIELVPGVKLENNVTVTNNGGHLSLAPSVMASYSRAEGLELGLRSRFAWDSSLSFEGDTNVRAKIFRTPRVGPPGVWTAIPIGPFPVPVRLRLVAFLECESMGKTQLDGTLQIHLGAHMGGSIRVKPSSAPLASWVTEGSWPFELGGQGSAKLEGNIYFGAGSGIECTLPRVELETLIAGVAGPYIAIAPEFRRTLTQQGQAANSMNITLKVGMRGRLFGREANSELDLLSWKPD
jgi:hypothetical protein